MRNRGFTATAVCPGPIDTEFEEVGGIAGHSRMFALLPYCDQVQVARNALLAARRGQAVYTPRLFYKTYRLLGKLLPWELLTRCTGV